MACFKTDYCAIIRITNIAIGVVIGTVVVILMVYCLCLCSFIVIIISSSIAIAVTEFWRLSLLLLGGRWGLGL